MAPSLASAANMISSPTSRRQASDYNIYFGDVHNHNTIGYAQGSLARTFDIAHNHLDFYALTPHAHWHDMGEYEGNIERIWTNGFAVTKVRWNEVMEMNRNYHDPGSFVTIPGYEWHSSNMGDYHILFPDIDAELYLPDTLEELQNFVRERGCIMIPHHPANKQGRRGANFAERDPDLAPLLEVYSEWGNAVYDRGPYPYIRHSPGGRWTKNTLQYRLAQGDRLGVIASTDDHFGKPGSYYQGLAVVLAPELTREAIFDALWNRRTYAVTGDRIEMQFGLNGHVMGQELPFTRDRELQVSVAGWSQVNQVEIWKNNRIIHRDFPMDRRTSAKSWDEPVLIPVEYGWGPWAALNMAGTADWNIHLEIDNGRIESVHPAFQSGPYDENRRDEILDQTERSVRVRSFTARRQLFEDRAQKHVTLKVNAQPSSILRITTDQPSEKSWELPLKDLARHNEVLYTGPYPRESFLVHRLIFNEHYETSFTATDQDDGGDVNWYYVRVVQSNEQFAWSSPIWVEAAS